MGVMERLRASTKYILWILIISFGLLWMLADTQVFDAMMAGPRSLGSVNGDEITLESYNSRISQYLERYRNQTGESITPERRAQIEEQVWNELVATKLLKYKMDEMGITVTNAELVDMITGENPDPFIKQQFGREDGTIDRQALQQAIQAPENKQVWIMVEQQLRQKRRQEKMNNFVQSAISVSDREVQEEYVRSNSEAAFSFVRFPYAEVTNDELDISEDDLREYYNNHLNKYQRKREYRFEYISFSKMPTKEDTLRTIEEMKRLKPDFVRAEDDSTFLARYQSETDYNEEYVEKDDIKESLKPVLDLEEGEVSDVILENGRVHLLKLIDERRDEVKFVNFSFDVRADPVATIDKMAEEAADFSFFAEQDGFKEEAERREFEVQSSFASKGNNFIAGLGQSRQVLSFLNRADEGQISEPIELQDQFVVVHVLEITPAGDRPFDEVKEQVRNVVVNNKRRQLVEEKVSRLVGEHGDLASMAAADGKEVKSVNNVKLNETLVPGYGREPKVIGAVFRLDEGQISPPIVGNNAVYVVQPKTLKIADASSLTQSTREQMIKQLQQEKQQVFLGSLMDQLKEEADIEDYRDVVLQ